MAAESYHQFCPVAMAAEILGTRWTLVLLRELVLGSRRFNELRRGVPRMSPALLSKRLKELEAAGIVTRGPVADEAGAQEYRLTEAGLELRPIIEAVGVWGQRWVTTSATLRTLDPNLLMWDIRRNLHPASMPQRRNTIQFVFEDLPESQQNYWLIVEPEREVDLCKVDPGFDVDLYFLTDLRTLTEIWLGYLTIPRARDDARLMLTGDRRLEEEVSASFRLSLFAKVQKRVG